MSTDSKQRFYGKYRGKVKNNSDPLSQGRIRAYVPAVFGEKETGWALPCSPYAGNGVGIFFVPPKDANVWIEFEDGNPEYPIWSGCFWGKGEAPKIPAVPKIKLIKTEFATIIFDDGSQNITIETKTGLKIFMDKSEIELSNRSANKIIKLSPVNVTINNTALDIK